jgi:hypothetical protein
VIATNAAAPTPKTTADFSRRLNSPHEGAEFVIDSIETMALRATALLSIAADGSTDDLDSKQLYWLLNSVQLELADILAIINAHGSEALNHQA